MEYRGIVKDDMKALDDRKTKWYSTYAEAHSAAEKLCKRTYGDRGSIDVETRKTDLVGVTEAAEILGWPKGKVSTYHKRGKMPETLADLKGGPVWSKKDILNYKEESKMEITIAKGNHGHVFFTTHSHYGIPVVRVEMAEEEHDLGPGDAVPNCLENQEHQETFGGSANIAEWVHGQLLVNSDPEAVKAYYRWSAQLPGYDKEIPGHKR